MIAVALVTFAVLLVCWLVAPADGPATPRRGPIEPESALEAA